ncbi:hypothetical protein [Candidatus Sororendozoicomonas aggregata]|uniref:hypothetical protein n=1 Tax=Candidatus Sororendozoicomonas aggregata TaxID=3073239 RepID=UPI002ED44B10
MSDEMYCDSAGLSALNGGCSSAFQHNLIQIINGHITKKAKPKGSGMDRDMRVDLNGSIKYFVGSELVGHNCETRQESLEHWNKLVSDDHFRWVKDNIEALSTFLHQGFIFDIFTAQSMTGRWFFYGNNITSLGLISENFILFKLSPEQIIRIIITSDVGNIYVGDNLLLPEDSSHINFSVKLTLRFKTIETPSGAILQACFDPGDSYENFWYVKAFPTLVKALTFS